MAAPFARERSGEGCWIEFSLFDSVGDWMNMPLFHHRYGGAAPKRVGVNHATSGAHRERVGPAVMRRVPELGEHTATIRQEFLR